MCGRARLSSDVSELRLVFGIPGTRPAPNFAASWNVAPTDMVPVVRWDQAAGERSLDLLRWGLVPYWAKDLKIGYPTFNAKAEGIESRPAFREPFRKRRCLVPFDSFYEWRKSGRDKEPYAIARADGGVMAMAGLWDSWRSPAGERLRSFTIVTTVPNRLCAELHDRMPVVLNPAAWPLWLGEHPAKPEELLALLRPCPSEWLEIWPVSKRVGDVRNNDPSLIERVAAPDTRPHI